MKRNCRRTQEDKDVHERAIRIRRMTDEQICDVFDSAFGKGVEEGLKLAGTGQPAGGEVQDGAVVAFINYLEGKVGTGNKLGRGSIIQLHRELERAVADGLFGRVGQ